MEKVQYHPLSAEIMRTVGIKNKNRQEDEDG
jgi:hypothetical protein